jgi:hypothetical protein
LAIRSEFRSMISAFMFIQYIFKLLLNYFYIG